MTQDWRSLTRGLGKPHQTLDQRTLLVSRQALEVRQCTTCLGFHCPGQSCHLQRCRQSGTIKHSIDDHHTLVPKPGGGSGGGGGGGGQRKALPKARHNLLRQPLVVDATPTWPPPNGRRYASRRWGTGAFLRQKCVASSAGLRRSSRCQRKCAARPAPPIWPRAARSAATAPA